jgi:gastrin-releasing peptide receptor
VKGIWWGVLEKGQCLQGNISYYGDYENASYSYTLIEDMNKNTDIENEQFYNTVKTYRLPVVAVYFLFGTTFNVILIIIITCNKSMQTVPNMYILNLAVCDIIILTGNFFYECGNRNPVFRPHDGILCGFIPFFSRMVIVLTANSIAVFSFQRYRVTVNPIQALVSSQPTWRSTVATICGVWIVAALIAFPVARTEYLLCISILIGHKFYCKLFAIFHLFVSCVLPLCVIAFSYIMTARNLLVSSRPITEETQNPQLNTRKNTAKILLGLTFVLLISYVPYHITKTYFCFSINYDVSAVELDDVYVMVDNLNNIMKILMYLLLINSCLNPVALFCTSNAFRRHFKRYLICCCNTNSRPTDFELTNTN